MVVDSLAAIQRLLLEAVKADTPLLGALATQDKSNRTRVRMVVIRQFDPDEMRISLSTDSRSAKVAQLRANPWAEVCIWSSGQRIALRLMARWTVIQCEGQSDLSTFRLQQFWDAHSAASKALFLGASPGEPYEPAVLSKIPVRFPDTFVELSGQIFEIDALAIGREQLRWRYQRQNTGGWAGMRINP